MGRARISFLVVVAAGILGLVEGCRPQAGSHARCALIARPTQPVRPTADEVAEARRLFDHGAWLAVRRRWGEALDAFHGAQRRVDHPTTSYNAALALWQLGRHEDVIAELTHFNIIYDPVRDRALYERARELMERARRRVASLALTVAPAGAAVRIDGVERPGASAAQRDFTLDPGPHAVEVGAPGRRGVRFVVHARPGRRLSRVVSLPGAARPR